MKSIISAYAAGIVILVLGTVALGGVIGGLFWFTDTAAGINITEQVAWFRPAVIWGGATLICVCAALCVADMLEDQSYYVWYWPAVAVATSSVGNGLLGEPFITGGVLYAGAVAVVTVVVSRAKVIQKQASA
ncbi:MAG: hypothetical protein SWN10_23450 [Pseudomonadota bacterium]|nr:hypothetical protein [Pseudomonadota bacterium]